MTWLPVLVGFLDMIVAVLLIMVARRLLKLSNTLYEQITKDQPYRPPPCSVEKMIREAGEYDRNFPYHD